MYLSVHIKTNYFFHIYLNQINGVNLFLSRSFDSTSQGSYDVIVKNKMIRRIKNVEMTNIGPTYSYCRNMYAYQSTRNYSRLPACTWRVKRPQAKQKKKPQNHFSLFFSYFFFFFLALLGQNEDAIIFPRFAILFIYFFACMRYKVSPRGYGQRDMVPRSVEERAR